MNKTIVYNYNVGGNITSKIEYHYTTGTLGTATSTINYSYGDSNWKDKLTSYNGKAITYDQIGNPLNDGNYNYTWEECRQLSGISGNGKTIAYKYNDAGIRTQKIVNGVTTNYHLEGDNVIYESNGTDKIYYTYDSEGKLLSMNLNGSEYYYIRNAQGDIIGLFDKNGATVATYTYDTWGKLISIKDSSGTDITNNTSSVGYKNPYRYRGYRYDTETGLYYLQSRYYNPEWGRFINADGIIGQTGELLGHNIFMYSKNNPVNMQDNNGDRPIFSGSYEDETDEQRAVSFAIMNHRYDYGTGTIRKSNSSSFDVAGSVVKNAKGATMDKAASRTASAVASGAKKWVSSGVLTIGKYVDNPSLCEVIKTKALGSFGSIAFVTKDIITSVSNRQYVGACMDLVAGAAGIGAGYGLEMAGAAIIAAVGAPELLVAAGVVAGGMVIGVGIDYFETRIKEEHYRRK